MVGNSDTIDAGPFGKNPLEQQMTGRCIFNNSLKGDMFGRWLGTDAPSKIYSTSLSLHRKLTRHKARYRYRGLNRVGDPGIGSSCCVSVLSSRPCQLPWLARFPWLPPIQSRITGGYQVSNATAAILPDSSRALTIFRISPLLTPLPTAISPPPPTCLFTPADLRRQSEYFYSIVFGCAI